MARLVVKLKQLVSPQGKGGISPALVIANFHLVHTGRKSFHDSPDFAA
jgi:hypothetical protein